MSDKCFEKLLNFLLIKENWGEKIYSAVFNIIVIINVFSAANQNILMISEGSCDWSIDAEN